jgi:hypothetical protein
MESRTILAAAAAFMCVAGASSSNARDLIYEWYTVANNGDLIPETTKTFNSYNQPAVNGDGMVVFRARSKGGEGQGPGAAQPARGIYLRDLGESGPIMTVFKRGGMVPEPVNLDEAQGKQPSFNEFPSIPRIDSGSDTIATRGQSTPVWGYTDSNGLEARTGTAGVYVNPRGVPTTAASMVGDVMQDGVLAFPYFQVPVHGDVAPGTGFDQFPGSPAVTERKTIVFKGNFSSGGRGRTGIFYRDVLAARGRAPVELIAASGYTDIPGCEPVGEAQCKFGSTAPPSAGGKYVVFVGYDNEATPTVGGIYRAHLVRKPIRLETVVKIGDPVPGETDPNATFKAFSEAVSVTSNGRVVLFWGTWGDEQVPVELACASDGNKQRRAYCLEQAAGDPDFNRKSVPLHQGFFVRDMQLGRTAVIAKTGGEFRDFIYWNFSGRVPGMPGEGDDIEEPARWRTATFGAVSGNGAPSVSAIKARSVDGEDGIYLRDVLPSNVGDLFTLLKTGMPGAAVDPETPAGAPITSVGIERDGFRGDWLAVTLAMGVEGDSEEDAGWAGTYAARFIDEEPVTP